MATIADRLARIEKRAALDEGPRRPLVDGIALNGAEIRALLAALDGRTRGLPSEHGIAPRPPAGTIH